MAVNLSMLAGAGAQFFDNSGVILSGGLIYTYAAGTTTPQAAYTSSSGSTPLANPIVLDSAGRVPTGEIWLTEAIAYKFVLQTSVGVTIATYDNVTGNASGVAASVAAGIYSTFAASSGSSLVGYTQGGAGAVATTVQGKFRQTVSAYDFMTAAQIADVQSFTPVLDVTLALQAAIDAVQPGQRLYIPYGFYKHTGLTVSKAMFIYGDLSPEFFDNEAFKVLNRGTILWQYASTGNNITVQPPSATRRRMMFHMQDILLVGAIWDGTNYSGTPTSGHGLYIDGRNALSETQVIPSWQRIGSCYHAEHGVFLTGSVYGSDAGLVTVFNNGKNNFRIQSSAEPIGEMSISHLRAFGGGSLATTDIDKANVYMSTGGLINFGFISATYAVTYAVLLAAGRYNIGSIQIESLNGTIDASRVLLQFGDGTTNPSASQIGIVTFAPSDAFPGTLVKFKSFATNNVINFARMDSSGATGSFAVFEANTDGNAIYAFSGSTSGTAIVDSGTTNIYDRFFSIASAYAKRGLWIGQNIGIGKENAGNVTSGSLGHGLFADGTANFSTSSSDAGGLAYQACNNNAAVADGYRFFSFRIGTTPSEIGKITVATSGTAINYATSSDYRLKENPQPITDALSRICQLKPVTFTWKSKQVLGEGFLAHELQEVFPAAVTGEKDQVGIDNEPLYQGVDASKIVAALVSAVQELTERIKVLEGK